MIYFPCHWLLKSFINKFWVIWILYWLKVEFITQLLNIICPWLYHNHLLLVPEYCIDYITKPTIEYKLFGSVTNLLKMAVLFSLLTALPLLTTKTSLCFPYTTTTKHILDPSIAWDEPCPIVSRRPNTLYWVFTN